MNADVDVFVEPTDYTQAFLQERQRRKLNDDNAEYFSEEQLILMLFDLWVAGQVRLFKGSCLEIGFESIGKFNEGF